MLHCNNVSLRKHKPFVPCSILLSNNYVIIKACSSIIVGSTNLAYSKKVNLQVRVKLSLEGLPLLLWQRKVSKIYLLCDRTLFYSSSLNFATQSLKVVSAILLLVWFVSLKESTCETRKNVRCFTSKAIIFLGIIKF